MASELAAAAQFIQIHDSFMILVHVRPDGDAIGAALACAHMLSHLGKSCRLVHESAIPVKYQFLPLSDRFEVFEAISPVEAVIAVDCGDRKQMGKGIQAIGVDTQLLNIDHHRTNDRFGTVNLVDMEAAATCQILYHLAKTLDVPFFPELAVCIYTGILFDTGGFRYSNTTQEIHAIGAEMIAAGVSPYDVSDRVLETFTWPQLQLLKECLPTIQRDDSGKLAWIVTTRHVLELTKAREDECEGLVDFARNIEGVEVGVAFRESGDGRIKVSLRSKYYVDVSEIAVEFSGGGHARAAGCMVEGSLKEVMEKVLTAVQTRLTEA
ncbi:bifunctional oligoribonuclease/PAP phosphatase NrnA [Fodinisporobacter ferrooxydans]|uniref:Bifunctional oligoribonuclease/PAP phosphatase NrnA n=1 Tax=Fodinisporobacter ferrooxydans TaxID=2901836 RepID=A0ABY4CFT1_9BACL|nr:bifunctional oligoribonuclease/PAP phosphatase NrnA [Alicyclobacillaceae bacterium MYW30-H2]